jgi:hypothetical protein
MKEESILHMGDDKMIQRLVYSKLLTDFLTQVNGKAGFNLREMGDKSGRQMVPKQMKALGPE